MPIDYHINQLPLFPTGKICNSCHIEKSLEEFYKDSHTTDGYRGDCIDCWYIHHRKDPAKRIPRPLYILPVGVTEKVCNRCGDKKAVEEFSRNPSSGDGYKSICRTCDYATTKARREAQGEDFRMRQRESDKRNIDHKRQYRKENAERHNAHIRNRRANDPAYRQAMNEYQSEYASTHREQMNRYVRKWKEANPLKGTEYAMRYKARKQAVTTEQVDYELIFQACDGICYICNQQILPHHDIEFDHIIPITRQGPHSYENIAVVHDICNSRKNNKLLEEMTPFQRRGPSS
jgi:hypothetical protein